MASIQLSPLNKMSVVSRVLSTSTPLESLHETKRVEEVVMYKCPECGELHEWESDAIDCCKTEAQEQGGSPPSCPVCGEKYHTHRHAADCCLWKDLDAPSRWAIADAVEAGSEWDTELGLQLWQMAKVKS